MAFVPATLWLAERCLVVVRHDAFPTEGDAIDFAVNGVCDLAIDEGGLWACLSSGGRTLIGDHQIRARMLQEEALFRPASSVTDEDWQHMGVEQLCLVPELRHGFSSLGYLVSELPPTDAPRTHTRPPSASHRGAAMTLRGVVGRMLPMNASRT